ncbi:hypothetical protein [Pseudoalteromonas obscura]|uniref:Lipoprotein n=1 Tax=Pseudoalteromonas obscura TaxID=3048491 RepID=A0ABT7EMB9_9GAMM|nr:hypothetical protein [Pseudoalteromonas sp. P94(2023)]MDK2596202.1 hypothetical protein [Pseudoalteromonas sp. P94(2023)]
MRSVLFLWLLPLSFSSSAADIYFRGSECTEAANAKEVYLREEASFEKGEARKEVMSALKQRLLNKASQLTYEGNSTGYIVESLKFKLDEAKIKGGKITRSTRVTGFLQLSPVSQCSHGQKIKQDEANKLGFVYNYAKISLEKVELENAIRGQQLRSALLNKDSVYGLKLGTTYEQALNKIGRFSFDWQVDSKWRLTTIGRNTALYFHQGVLVGAQYNRQLLPMIWSNLIELAATKPTMEAGGVEVSLLHQAISDSYLAELEHKYDMLDYDTFRVSEDEVELRLSGVVIGDTLSLKEVVPTMACYDERRGVQSFIDEYGEQLPAFYDQLGNKGLITGCSQIINLWDDRNFKSLSLIEQANFNSAKLLLSKAISNALSDWSFYNVKYLNGISAHPELVIKDSKDGIYEVQIGGWFGHFSTDQELAYEGVFYLQ